MSTNRTSSNTPAQSPWTRVAFFGLVATVVATLIVLPSGILTPAVTPSDTKLDLALQQSVAAGRDDQLRVIVSAVSGHAQDAALAVTDRGAKVLDRFDAIGAVTTIVRVDQILGLAADGRVRNLSSDGIVVSAQYGSQAADNGHGRGNGTGRSSPDTSTGITTDTDGTSSWQTENLAQNHVINTLGIDSESWDGNGVRIAVVDSGVAAREEVWGQWDFRNGQDPAFNGSEFPSDPYGHGTHVAGLITNSAKYSHGLYQGLAPDAKLLASACSTTMGWDTRATSSGRSSGS